MNHLMIDIETLGTKPGSAVLSVGAVFFDIKKPPAPVDESDKFYYRISIDEMLKNGFTADGDTIKWWLKQTSAAQESAFFGHCSIDDFIAKFKEFCTRGYEYHVWANPPSFDLVMIESIFNHRNKKMPFPYWMYRCSRTFMAIAKQLNPNIGLLDRQGVHHNALDDAIYQAHNMQHVNQKVGIYK